MHKRLGSAILALGIILATLGPAIAAGPDYDVPGGHFYTQTGGGGDQGFSVLDTTQDSAGHTARFWSEFRRLGAVNTLGYPVSHPYVGPGGLTYQAFQRGVLQWRPDANAAFLSNTFEWLQDAGKDSWLLEAKGVPGPITDDGSGGDFAKAVQTRLGWLTDSAIKAKYLANPNPRAISGWSQDRAIELYGLPMSNPEKHGPFVSQRFQRIVLQLWVEDVSGMPSKGTVVGVLGGDLLKEAGMLPAEAIAALGPGGTPPPPVAATPAPTQPPAPAPGSYPWRYEMKSWASNCGTTYMYGHVYDRAGNLVNGMSVKSWNDWGNVVISGSGSDSNRGTGGWVRLVNNKQNPQTWYVAIVDGAGNPASDTFTVKFDGDCSNGAQVVEVDFHEN